MTPFARGAVVAVLAVATGLAGTGRALSPAPPSASGSGQTLSDAGAAWLVVDVSTGRTLDTRGGRILRTPILPGSIAKIATLIAALDAGVVSPGTTMTCRRRIVVEGETLTCSHPQLGRPLTLAEALAHSCNFVFGSIAARLRREDLDRTLVSLGLPPSDVTER